MDNNSELLNVTCAAVRKAGVAVMEIYNTDFSVEEKEDKTPVTEADKRAHEILVSELKQCGYPILSEEGDGDEPAYAKASAGGHLGAERLWIIDPLDGTADFVDKTGEFSIMVGLVENGSSILGAVYVPATDKLYYAQKGAGAYLEEGGTKREIHVSDVSEPSEARAVVSRSHVHPDVEKTLTEMGITKMVPTGSNGIKIGRIAEGKAEIFLNPTNRMGEWDSCGPHIILEEAGGYIAGANGNRINYNKPGAKLLDGIFASNGKLRAQKL